MMMMRVIPSLVKWDMLVTGSKCDTVVMMAAAAAAAVVVVIVVVRGW